MDVREIFDPALERGSVKLLRVRNPWGQTGWKGSWSDKSAEWQQLLYRHNELERSNVDDGTFWIDLTHFIMAFGDVDVCFARTEKDGYHAKSFENAFPLRKSVMRVCRDAYYVQTESISSTNAIILHVMTLQPTGRGKWCRDDRKVSYKPGDISVLILKREKETFSKVEELSMRGGGEVHRRSVAVRLEPNETYLVVCLNPGSTPAAAASRTFQPFKVRFVCNEPLRVTSFAFDTKKYGKTVLSALHSALFSWTKVNYVRLHEELVPSRIWCTFSRRHLGTIRGGVEIWSFLWSSNMFLIVARNRLEESVSISVQVDVKVGCVRYCGDLGESLLKPDLNLSKIAQAEEERVSQNNTNSNVKRPWEPKRSRLRARAKWRSYKVNVKLKSKSEQIMMIVSGTSRMFRVGRIQFEDETNNTTSSVITSSLSSWLGTINSWFGKQSVRSCLFEPLPLDHNHDRVHARKTAATTLKHQRDVVVDDDDNLKRALEASLLEQQERRKRRKLHEEKELKRALELSRAEVDVVDLCDYDDDDSDCVVVNVFENENQDEETKAMEMDLCNVDDRRSNKEKGEEFDKKSAPAKPDMNTLRMLRLKRFQT